MKDKRVHYSYFAASKYIIFFILTAIIVTISFNIFVSTLQDTIGYTFSEAQIKKAAILTFISVLLISAVITLLDYLVSIYRIKKPVENILSFTDKLAGGSFGEEMKLNHPLSSGEFDIIISNLNRLSKELSGIENMRGDFIANISHEIKTPIAIIQNYAQLLLESEVDETKRSYITSILSSSKRLSKLVSDILYLTKIEKQEIFNAENNFSLSEELAEAILSFESKFEEKSISLNTDIEEDVYIKSNKELLSIIFNNILSNAIKFTALNGSISVSLKRDDERCIIKISDTGCGISKEEITHIFDKFYQGSSSHKKEGNGLGLALVKRIATILSIDITVTSEEKKGTTFTLFLTL